MRRFYPLRTAILNCGRKGTHNKGKKRKNQAELLFFK